MIKIMAAADFHIGSRPDMISYYNNELEPYVKEVEKRKPDLVVICGDLFDRKISTNSDFNTYANLFINKLAEYAKNNGSKLIILKGTLTHDLNQLNSFSYLLESYKGFVYIINTVYELESFGMNILLLPEEYEPSKKEYYESTIYNKNKKYDFVFGHGMFKFAGGYVTESGRDNNIVFDTKDFADNVYGLVIFGHVHIKMSKDNCYYCGSFSRDSFGEEEPKGSYYIEYDEDKKEIKKFEFIENTKAPTYVSINAKDVPDKDIGIFLNDKLSIYYKLRVIIDSEISEQKLADINACKYSMKNLFVLKKVRSISATDIAKDKEAEKKREERKLKLEQYKLLSFEDRIKTFAKEKFGIDFTFEEIRDAVKQS